MVAWQPLSFSKKTSFGSSIFRSPSMASPAQNIVYMYKFLIAKKIIYILRKKKTMLQGVNKAF